jgi:hypothetical protein
MKRRIAELEHDLHRATAAKHQLEVRAAQTSAVFSWLWRGHSEAYCQGAAAMAEHQKAVLPSYRRPHSG